MWFNFLTFEEKQLCSLCKQLIDEGYIPHTEENEEYEKLEQIFKQDISEWLVCEWCLEGSCGVVPDNQPNDWLERQWEKIEKKKESEE